MAISSELGTTSPEIIHNTLPPPFLDWVDFFDSIPEHDPALDPGPDSGENRVEVHFDREQYVQAFGKEPAVVNARGKAAVTYVINQEYLLARCGEELLKARQEDESE